MKNIIAVFIAIGISLGNMIGVTDGSEKEEIAQLVISCEIKVGDYIRLGKYENTPIMWRCVSEDKNGKLMLSDKALCKKMYGIDDEWETSWLRTWLNSAEAKGETTYYRSDKLIGGRYEEDYGSEAGFLCKDNFNEKEKGVIKTVSLKSCIPEYEEGELHSNYYLDYGMKKEFENEGKLKAARLHFLSLESKDIEERVFCLDVEQLLAIQNSNLGDYIVSCELIDGEWYNGYWTRTPLDGCHMVSIQANLNQSHGRVLSVWGGDEKRDFVLTSDDVLYGGYVRPAFYIDESARILSGDGTRENPYVFK